MKKRFLFVFIMLMLCAGCKAEYNLTINDDLSVEETVLATDEAEFFEEYEKSSIGRVVGFLLEPHLDILNENDYTTNSYITSGRSGATVNKKYSNIEDYVNNTIFSSQYGEELTYSKDGNKITLSINGNFSKAEQDQTRIPVNEAVISIKLPFKVIDNNADKVSGDVYTWTFNESDTEDREIRITFDKSKVKKSINFGLIGIIVGIIILLIVLFMVYNNVKTKRESVNKI